MADPKTPTTEQAEDHVPGRIYGGPPSWAFMTPRELQLKQRESLRAKQKAKAKQSRRSQAKVARATRAVQRRQK